MEFAYECGACGPFDSTECADAIQCRCGRRARRRYAVQFNRSSLRPSGRWDPVVGAYVENDRQFRSLLSRGQDEQAEKLQMDVHLATADARDHEALAELHGQKPETRAADLEATERARHDRMAV